MNSVYVRRTAYSFLLAIVIASPAVFAQSPDVSAKLRLAQNYEQAGSFESALKLYEELFARDKSNYVLFDAVRRMYLQLKRYDDAVVLIKNRLALAPNDLPLHLSLASTLYKQGHEKEADEEWKKVIESNPASETVYRMVAQSMMENRLLEKTADVYRRARIACKDPGLFTIDLAQLLATSMDYAGASAEFISWLRHNPTQLAFVQGRMATYTNKDEGRNAAIEAVKNALRKNNDPKLYELLGWVYLEGKDYANAFEAYRTLDKETNAQGAQIYAFAERAFKERAFDAAAKAYREAISIPVREERLPYAKYGYACSLKELSILSDTLGAGVASSGMPATESQPQYAGAVAKFNEIIKEYPHTEFSAKSYYQIGTIQYERFFDLDGALAAFDHVLREIPGQGVIHYDVALKVGEVLTAKGDTARAAVQFRLVESAPGATPDQHDEAVYRLARLAYFRNDFQSAMTALGNITLNMKADYANDALELLAFLQENKTTGEAALVQFARADFLATQRKNTEAIPLFLALADKYPQALLVDDALMKAAVLQTQARRYEDAIASYERLLSQFKESSIALDKAQFGIGEVYRLGLNDKPKAIAAYEKLLADFPQSLLATTARKRIRELRGDSL